MTNEEYKKLSIKEFTKAASVYESDRAGIYEMCKKDYPDILEELEKEPFTDLLDAGCRENKITQTIYTIKATGMVCLTKRRKDNNYC